MEIISTSQKSIPLPVDNKLTPLIKERVVGFILAKGLRQIDLARRCGLDRSYLWRILNSTQNPPDHIKIRIAKELGVDSRAIWEDKK
ncbi:MAG TPA: helix-turn-helix transcriptional regulator [Candidatus Nanoarchaeia archaeon]|nr:helix-turn-helix transcriptional regulator [Candidatus Nanoarchaeia archaeon]